MERTDRAATPRSISAARTAGRGRSPTPNGAAADGRNGVTTPRRRLQPPPPAANQLHTIATMLTNSISAQYGPSSIANPVVAPSNEAPLMPCAHCGTFATRQHQLKCAKKPTGCADCGMQGLTAASLPAHRAVCIAVRIPCPGCGDQIERGTLRGHVSAQCPARSFTCHECGQAFWIAEEYLQHAYPRCKNGVVSCQLCGELVGGALLAQHYVLCAQRSLRTVVGSPAKPTSGSAMTPSQRSAKLMPPTPGSIARTTPRRSTTTGNDNQTTPTAASSSLAISGLSASQRPRSAATLLVYSNSLIESSRQYRERSLSRNAGGGGGGVRSTTPNNGLGDTMNSALSATPSSAVKQRTSSSAHFAAPTAASNSRCGADDPTSPPRGSLYMGRPITPKRLFVDNEVTTGMSVNASVATARSNNTSRLTNGRSTTKITGTSGSAVKPVNKRATPTFARHNSGAEGLKGIPALTTTGMASRTESGRKPATSPTTCNDNATALSTIATPQRPNVANAAFVSNASSGPSSSPALTTRANVVVQSDVLANTKKGATTPRHTQHDEGYAPVTLQQQHQQIAEPSPAAIPTIPTGGPSTVGSSTRQGSEEARGVSPMIPSAGQEQQHQQYWGNEVAVSTTAHGIPIADHYTAGETKHTAADEYNHTWLSGDDEEDGGNGGGVALYPPYHESHPTSTAPRRSETDVSLACLANTGTPAVDVDTFRVADDDASAVAAVDGHNVSSDAAFNYSDLKGYSAFGGSGGADDDLTAFARTTAQPTAASTADANATARLLEASSPPTSHAAAPTSSGNTIGGGGDASDKFLEDDHTDETFLCGFSGDEPSHMMANVAEDAHASANPNHHQHNGNADPPSAIIPIRKPQTVAYDRYARRGDSPSRSPKTLSATERGIDGYGEEAHQHAPTSLSPTRTTAGPAIPHPVVSAPTVADKLINHNIVSIHKAPRRSSAGLKGEASGYERGGSTCSATQQQQNQRPSSGATLIVSPSRRAQPASISPTRIGGGEKYTPTHSSSARVGHDEEGDGLSSPPRGIGAPRLSASAKTRQQLMEALDRQLLPRVATMGNTSTTSTVMNEDDVPLSHTPSKRGVSPSADVSAAHNLGNVDGYSTIPSAPPAARGGAIPRSLSPTHQYNTYAHRKQLHQLQQQRVIGSPAQPGTSARLRPVSPSSPTRATILADARIGETSSVATSSVAPPPPMAVPVFRLGYTPARNNHAHQQHKLSRPMMSAETVDALRADPRYRKLPTSEQEAAVKDLTLRNMSLRARTEAWDRDHLKQRQSSPPAHRYFADPSATHQYAIPASSAATLAHLNNNNTTTLALSPTNSSGATRTSVAPPTATHGGRPFKL